MQRSGKDFHYLSVKSGRWINLEDIETIYYQDHKHTMSCGCIIEYKWGKDPRYKEWD